MTLQQPEVISDWEEIVQRITPKPQIQSAFVAPEQTLLRNADRKVESLEIKLSESATIIQGTRTDLYNCQKARHEEIAALSTALLREQKRHHACQHAYQSVCQQNQQTMQEIQSVRQQNQRFMQDVHTLALTKRQLERELADLRGGNQASEDDGISQASPEKRSLVDKAREIIRQTKAMNAELDRQAGAKMEGLQQLTPSLEPHDADFTQPLIEEQPASQETVQKKRASNTDDRVEPEGEKRQVKRARKPRQLKLKEQSDQVTDCK